MPPYRISAQNLSAQLMFSTIRVELRYEDDQVGSGTAFFCSHQRAGRSEPPSDYLVTNKHVLEGATGARFRFHTAGSGAWHDFSPGPIVSFQHALPQARWIPHPEEGVDLCAIAVSDFIRVSEGPPVEPFYSAISTSLVPTEEEERRYLALMEVMMIGAPQGLWDEENNLPILRRGSTATHPAIDYDGKPEFMVDIACFPGSSGSPVVSHDSPYFGGASYRFFGVLYAGPTFAIDGALVRRSIPTTTGAGAPLQAMMHLGYAVKARKVKELLELLAAT